MELVQWGSVAGATPDTIRLIRVRFKCQYPGDHCERDGATYIAGGELGPTSADVHEAIWAHGGGVLRIVFPYIPLMAAIEGVAKLWNTELPVGTAHIALDPAQHLLLVRLPA